jgi:aspartyl-tRNA(Asn)/glutamyl-tRNA(Gln) amidotransferase subunit B
MSALQATGWELVIGLEVHAQLRTRSKLFSDAPVQSGDRPNTAVTALCLGLPGALPRLNREAVHLAATVGVTLGCEVQLRSQFARKSYFYPDLPKGYQISQAELPICRGGSIPFMLNGVAAQLPLERIHLEEDAGKSVHDQSGDVSLIDLNRAGVPLIEIVSLPTLRSADAAAAVFAELRLILLHLDACDGSLEHGSMRCDANVSVRKIGESALRTRCEIKNLNSMRSLREAIDWEAARQVDIWTSGGSVRQETRLWDVDASCTRSMRGKENAADYRYAPDPDLPWVQITTAELAQWTHERPIDVDAMRIALRETYELDADSLALVLDLPPLCRTLIGAGAQGLDVRAFVSFLAGPVLGQVKRAGRDLGALPGHVDALTTVFTRWRSGLLSNQMMAQVLQLGFTAPDDGTLPTPDALLAALESVGTIAQGDGELEAVVADLVARHANEVGQFRAGKSQVLGFFIGQAMRALKGRADAQRLRQLLVSALEG